MKKQNQIKRTLSQSGSIEHIREIFNSTPEISRNALADELCEQFNFFNPGGDKQRSGCLKVLRLLERQNKVELPSSQRKP